MKPFIEGSDWSRSAPGSYGSGTEPRIGRQLGPGCPEKTSQIESCGAPQAEIPPISPSRCYRLQSPGSQPDHFQPQAVATSPAARTSRLGGRPIQERDRAVYVA